MAGLERGLRLRSVVAGYGGRPVVHGVSLDAGPGEVVGLIGPNGSGKTTLVRVASRGLHPAEGSVRVEGLDPYAMSPRHAARMVAVVPQEVVPAFDYSVLELVLMGRSPYLSPWGGGRADDWARAREAMARTDVQHLADRTLDQLSGGERQRVILAQALAQDAPVLLLDEPTTHLDLGHVVDLLAMVRRLARGAGKAVLAIFHDLTLAGAYCDRLYALSAGRVVGHGSPAEVLTAPLVREVFAVDVDVLHSPATGLPVLAPARRSSGRTAPVRRVHVVGGAGRGAGSIWALAERGFEVTAGVLHASDTDADVAERLNLVRVTVPAFSAIDHRSASDCLELMAGAWAVLICDPPFGPGNLENLRLALRAHERGVSLVLLEREPIEERDFTGGIATELWREIRERASVVRSEQEAAESCAVVSERR